MCNDHSNSTIVYYSMYVNMYSNLISLIRKSTNKLSHINYLYIQMSAWEQDGIQNIFTWHQIKPSRSQIHLALRHPFHLDTCRSSILIPYGTDIIEPFSSAEAQMKRIRLDRMRNEKDYFNTAKIPNFMDTRERYGNLKKYCSICSEYSSTINPGGRLVNHIHNSSKKYRNQCTCWPLGKLFLHYLFHDASLFQNWNQITPCRWTMLLVNWLM